VDFYFDGSFEYTSEPTFNSISSSDGGFSGTVTADNCITFGGSSSINVGARVRDQAGNVSNLVSQIVVRPSSSYP
jgi:hypothetical protein